MGGYNNNRARWRGRSNISEKGFISIMLVVLLLAMTITIPILVKTGETVVSQSNSVNARVFKENAYKAVGNLAKWEASHSKTNIVPIPKTRSISGVYSSMLFIPPRDNRGMPDFLKPVVGKDPWGNRVAYYSWDLRTQRPPKPGLVVRFVSPGADGVIATKKNDEKCKGDDICYDIANDELMATYAYNGGTTIPAGGGSGGSGGSGSSGSSGSSGGTGGSGSGGTTPTSASSGGGSGKSNNPPSVCYKLTVTTSGHGSVSRSPSKTCYHNERVFLSEHPSSGYIFSRWGGSCSSCGSRSTCSILVNSNKVCSAVFVIRHINHTPNRPSIPSGPRYGYEYHNYSFSTLATDPDAGDRLTYQYYWGDGHYSGWGSRIQSHEWTSTGWKCVRARAKDSHGAISGWSGCHYIDVRYAYRAPSTPTVSGPTSGREGSSHRYTFTASSRGATEYMFSWGDGTTGAWGSRTQSHWWNRTGSFCIRVKAKNSYGQSAWSSCHWMRISSTSGSITHTPPSTPTVTGPNNGYTNHNYTFHAYSSGATQYEFDWGDGHFTWGSAYQSHTWGRTGSFCISVRAKNSYNQYSGWSSCHWIRITRLSTPSTPSTPSKPPTNICYHLAVSSSTGGSVSKSPNKTCYNGDSVTLTAIPNSGYKFLNWGSDCFACSTNSRCTITMNSNKSCYAYFKKIQKPSTPPPAPRVTGPPNGKPNSTYYFTASSSGATWYKFSWGDGTEGNWSASTQSHRWTRTGRFCVKARAENNSGQESNWGPCHFITITNPSTPSTPSTPSKPSTPSTPPPTPRVSGPTHGYTHTSYGFTAYSSGATYYKFNWGDLSYSSWGSNRRYHSWRNPGTYCVEAQAENSSGKLSTWSSCHFITITNPSTPSTPPPPTPRVSGPVQGYTHINYIFEAYPPHTGAKYAKIYGLPDTEFDWGDWFTSSWGSYSRSHSWNSPGNYCIKAMFRDKSGRTSGWSSCHWIKIINGTPTTPTVNGPTSGVVNHMYQFTASALRANEYQFDWGNGHYSGWGPNVGSYTWRNPGTYCVKAKAKNEIPRDGVGSFESAWSSCHWINIREPIVTVRTTVSGPTSGCIGKSYTFTASASGALRYNFSWGDGRSSTYSSSTQSHSWSSAGTYCVKAVGVNTYNRHFTWSGCHYISIKSCQSVTYSNPWSNVNWPDLSNFGYLNIFPLPNSTFDVLKQYAYPTPYY